MRYHSYFDTLKANYEVDFMQFLLSYIWGSIGGGIILGQLLLRSTNGMNLLGCSLLLILVLEIFQFSSSLDSLVLNPLPAGV